MSDAPLTLHSRIGVRLHMLRNGASIDAKAFVKDVREALTPPPQGAAPPLPPDDDTVQKQAQLARARDRIETRLQWLIEGRDIDVDAFIRDISAVQLAIDGEKRAAAPPTTAASPLMPPAQPEQPTLADVTANIAERWQRAVARGDFACAAPLSTALAVINSTVSLHQSTNKKGAK